MFTHHSAYVLLFSINMYPYVYHIIYYMNTNIECVRNMKEKRANMKVTNIKNFRIQRHLGYILLRCDTVQSDIHTYIYAPTV